MWEAVWKSVLALALLALPFVPYWLLRWWDARQDRSAKQDGGLS